MRTPWSFPRITCRVLCCFCSLSMSTFCCAWIHNISIKQSIQNYPTSQSWGPRPLSLEGFLLWLNMAKYDSWGISIHFRSAIPWSSLLYTSRHLTDITILEPLPTNSVAGDGLEQTLIAGANLNFWCPDLRHDSAIAPVEFHALDIRQHQLDKCSVREFQTSKMFEKDRRAASSPFSQILPNYSAYLFFHLPSDPLLGSPASNNPGLLVMVQLVTLLPHLVHKDLTMVVGKQRYPTTKGIMNLQYGSAALKVWKHLESPCIENQVTAVVSWKFGFWPLQYSMHANILLQLTIDPIGRYFSNPDHSPAWEASALRSANSFNKACARLLLAQDFQVITMLCLWKHPNMG